VCGASLATVVSSVRVEAFTITRCLMCATAARTVVRGNTET